MFGCTTQRLHRRPLFHWEAGVEFYGPGAGFDAHPCIQLIWEQEWLRLAGGTACFLLQGSETGPREESGEEEPGRRRKEESQTLNEEVQAAENRHRSPPLSELGSTA